LVQRIAKEHGDNARIVAVEKERYGGVLGFFQKEGHVLIAEVDEVDTNKARVQADSLVRAETSTRPVESLETLEVAQQRSSSDLVDEMIAGQALQTEDVFEITSLPRQPKTFAEALNAVTGSLGDTPVPLPEGLSETSMEWAELAMQAQEVRRGLQADARPTQTSPSRDNGTIVTHRLRAAGYPARLLAELASYGMDDASLERAFTITPQPRPLPRALGGIIAVVGPAERALELGKVLAEGLSSEATTLALITQDEDTVGHTTPAGAIPAPGIQLLIDEGYIDADPGTSILATIEPGFIAHDLNEVTDLAFAWRRDRIGIVAVECDSKVSSYDWVRSVLRTLTPAYVSLVTRASTKSDDVVAIANLIGGVDSLFVDGLDESLTPLAVLNSGIPVARIDGEPTSSRAWLGVLDALPGSLAAS
jgi:hypothetical protein